MPDHSDFIIAAYLVAAISVAVMVGAIVLDYRRLRRELARIGADNGR